MAKRPSDRFDTAGDLAEAVMAAASPAGRPVAFPAYRRALTRRALLDPFSIAVALGVLAAGTALGAFPLAVPLAAAVYGAAVLRAYFDPDLKRRVMQREHSRRRRAPPAARATGPSRTDDLVAEALDKEARIRTTIKQARLPYKDVSKEVDRLIATMRETAARAELLDQELHENPPEAIERRLEEVRDEDSPDQADLIDVLARQLTVQRVMETELERFYGHMGRVLIELDTVRGRLMTASTSAVSDNQERLAADVRGLRAEVGAVGEDMAEAYEGHAHSYPHFGTEQT
jgi:hypothetical protein